MANIDELIAKIDKLVSTIEFIGDTPNGYQLDEDDIRKKFEIETKGMDKRSAEYERMYDKMELALEMHEKNMQRIQDESLKKQEEEEKRTLENIEKRIKDHGKSKIKLLDEEYKKELQILKDAGKDTTELEKEYTDKRNEILKSGLLKGNQTVFEELNERFQKEYELYKDAEEDTYELEKAYKRKKRELFLQQSQQLVNAISNLVNAGEAQLKEIEDTWGVTNQAAHEYGRAVGYNANQIERLHNETLSWMSDNDISKQFNIGVDEMFKLMGAYNKEMGRAVALTNDSMLNLVSMKNVLGEEQALKFTANLDKFGLDVDAAKELVEGVVGDARRSGIVLNNLTQNVADNLHLAQQYTFEDGVEGLVRMAEKASAVKWNMEQTAAFAEKVSNVEGAIKTGAQLSVLGGPFAQFSNPMGMLYESLNDMEGLQDRIFAMFGNLGEWNQEKGMLDISVFDKQRIRAAASAMGLNYGEVINNVNQQARRNVVMEQIKSYGLDENTTELIANTGQIDRDTGRAYVMYNNEKVFANEIGGRGDKNKILDYLQKQANSSDENLRDIAHNTLGAKEMVEAVEKEFISDRADFFRSIGISKENVASTHEKIMYVKYGLDKVNQMLNVMLGVVQAIAAVSAFRGMFGGGTGNGLGVGVRGAAGGVGMNAVAKNTSTLGRMKNGLSGAWQSTKTGVGNFIRNGGAAMTVAMGSHIGAGYMEAQSDRLREKGLNDDANKVNIGAGALSGVGSGVAIGATIGSAVPIIGTVAGGIIGGIVGGISGAMGGEKENNVYEMQKKRDESAKKEEEELNEKIISKKNEFYFKTGLQLKGDYTPEFIESLMNGKNGLSTVAQNLLYSNGDGEVWEQMKPRYAKGGVLIGPTHAEGGMNVINNQTGEIIAEVEGNEGIVPKNIMEKFGTVENLINNAMKPLQPMGETLQIENANNTSMNSSLNVGGSANVNVGGTIQLSMPNGQTYNIANDPSAMKLIGDNVMRHIMMANQQMFNKTEFYRKW